MSEKRTCKTCAHLVLNGGGFYKGHPHCGHPNYKLIAVEAKEEA